MATIVEMINPLTGLPEQVDKLDHTAQEIDDAVDLAPQLSNPNLLDNWYFGNPVNQRGQTSYAGAGYSIDRWKVQNDTVLTVGSGYCTLSGSWDIRQKFEKLPQATYTISVLYKNSSAAKLQLIASNDIDADSSVAQTAKTEGLLFGTIANYNLHQVLITLSGSGSVDIIAAKLELGSQQTLAHQDAGGNWALNEIPNYGEQLAKCQRYFQLYSSADLRPAKAVDCRPVMRTDPSQGTIVIGSTTYYYNTADL